MHQRFNHKTGDLITHRDNDNSQQYGNSSFRSTEYQKIQHKQSDGNKKVILVGNKRPDWCPLVKAADYTPILEKLKAELSELEQLQNNETDQERYETRRDAINYIKGKISTYEYVVWVSNVG